MKAREHRALHRCLCGLALGLAGTSALAAGAAEQPLPGPPAGAVLQSLAGLAVVVALIVGAAWFVRRLSPGVAGGAGVLHAVAALPLGTRERVVIVEIGERWLVLGVAPGRVSALADLPKGEVPGAAAATPGAFGPLLARLRAKQDPGGPNA